MCREMFVGRAKPPANTATGRTFGVITVALEVERDTGEIVAADVILQSRVVSSFLVAMLVGRNLATGLSAIATDIEKHYHSVSQRAVIQAIYDAAKKYALVVGQCPPSSGLHIADFSLGSNNTYLQFGMRAAEETAARFRATIDVFDGTFDPATQLGQIETALGSGRYDAFIVEPTDSATTTPILLQAIKEKKMPVAVINTPLGGRDLNEGDALWEPGTVTFVGGQTHDIYVEWMQRFTKMAVDAYGDGGKAAAITGPKIGANAKNVDDVAKKMLPGTGINLVANEETDYTTAQAYEKARNVLQVHPDLRFIISNYSGMTQGIVRAVEEAGLCSQVKVCDFGGNEWALNAVRQGEIEMTAIMLPYTETERAVEAIADYVRGKQVPKFIDLTKDSSLPGTAFVNKANVDRFRPQYA